MTESDLILELSKRYAGAEPGFQVTEIHLFAISRAKELSGQSLTLIAEAATGKKSYGTELRKGMNIAPYVTVTGSP